MKFNLFSNKGPKDVTDGKRDIFVPTEFETGLISQFGGSNKDPFVNVQKAIEEAGILGDRRSKLWETIRESRILYGANKPGGQERR